MTPGAPCPEPCTSGKRGWSQATLARAANTPAQSLPALESGRGSRVATLSAVARALGCEEWLDQLAPGEGPSHIELLCEQRRRRPPRQRAPHPPNPEAT